MESHIAHCREGYWARDKRVLVNARLSRAPYEQAGIRVVPGGVMLISYETDVALYTRDGWLTVYGLYSATTRKHISYFLRELAETCRASSRFANYQTVKRAYMDGVSVNLWTGETCPVERSDNE